MADSDIQALVEGLYTLLYNAGSEVWGNRIWYGYIPTGTQFPYIWVTFQGGGDRQQAHERDPRIVLAIRVVYRLDKQSQSGAAQSNALTAAARIAALIDDKGTQDVTTGYINGAPNWKITTSQCNERISMTNEDAGNWYFIEGNQYLFNMEAV